MEGLQNGFENTEEVMRSEAFAEEDYHEALLRAEDALDSLEGEERSRLEQMINAVKGFKAKVSEAMSAGITKPEFFEKLEARIAKVRENIDQYIFDIGFPITFSTGMIGNTLLMAMASEPELAEKIPWAVPIALVVISLATVGGALSLMDTFDKQKEVKEAEAES